MNELLPSASIRCLEEQVNHNKVSLGGEGALLRLLPITQRRTGQGRVVARFLLGLYNSARYPFRLIDLTVLDRPIFNDCISVLAMSQERAKHLKEYFAYGAQRWEQLASYWRLDPSA